MHLELSVANTTVDRSLLFEPAVSNPVIPFLLILVLDGVAAFGLHKRHKLELAPHTVSRAMCVYLAATGIAWTVFGLQVMQDPAGDGLVAAAAICAGIAVAALVSIVSPPLTVVNAFMATATSALFSISPVIPVVVSFVSSCR